MSRRLWFWTQEPGAQRRRPVFLHMGAARRPDGQALAADSRSLLRNGQPWLPVMGEFHYARYPRFGMAGGAAGDQSRRRGTSSPAMCSGSTMRRSRDAGTGAADAACVTTCGSAPRSGCLPLSAAAPGVMARSETGAFPTGCRRQAVGCAATIRAISARCRSSTRRSPSSCRACSGKRAGR